MLFLRIRPCSRSPFGAWNKFHSPKKNVKNENKPRLQNSRVFHLEIANVHDGTSRSLPQDVDLPLSLLPWVNVYRKEPSAFIYDEHSRECTMFHFGIYRHSSRSHILESWCADRCANEAFLTSFRATFAFPSRHRHRKNNSLPRITPRGAHRVLVFWPNTLCFTCFEMNFVLSKLNRWHWKNNSPQKVVLKKITPQGSWSR